MNYWISVICSLSIGLPALLGWLYYNRLNRAFIPFVSLLTIGFINELFSLLLGAKGYSNSLNTNIFIIVEAWCLIWQFWCWRLWHHNKWLKAWVLAFLLVWLAEAYLWGFEDVYYSFSIIIFCFCITLMAIVLFCRRLFTIFTPLFKDSIFLICTGYIIYFTSAIMLEALWLFELTHYPDIYHYAISILSVVNIFTNLIYTYAIICTPIRQDYIFPSSLQV